MKLLGKPDQRRQNRSDLGGTGRTAMADDLERKIVLESSQPRVAEILKKSLQPLSGAPMRDPNGVGASTQLRHLL